MIDKIKVKLKVKKIHGSSEFSNGKDMFYIYSMRCLPN